MRPMACCDQPAGAVIRNVPHFSSKRTNYCSEATVQMLLRHFGFDMDQDTIHRAGWKLPQQLALLRGYFSDVAVGKANPTRIKAWIDRGIPVPLMLNYPTGEHKVLAVGYDNVNRALIVHDPDGAPLTQLPMTDLLDAHGAVFVEPARGLAAIWTPFKILKGLVGGR